MTLPTPPADDSIVSLSPLPHGAYVVRFTSVTTGESWTEPALSLAVVVDGDETALEPVVLDTGDGLPLTVSDYCVGRVGPMRWRMEPTS